MRNSQKEYCRKNNWRGQSIGNNPEQWQTKTIGEENIKTAQHFIKEFQININAQEVGGVKGRVLYYFIGDNSLYLTQIKDKDYGKFKLV